MGSFTNPYPASRLTVDTANSLANGLVHYWPLTDGSGTSGKDVSTTADDLTATGTPTWVSSDIGAGVQLVSNSTYLSSSVYGNTYQQWTPITIVLWVSSANASQNGLFQYGSSTTDGSPLYLLQNNSGTLRWYSKNIYGTGVSVSTNTWHQAVLTNDGTSVKYYFDGTLSQTITTSNTFGEDVTNKFWIGAGYRNGNTNQFQNVRIYNRALSATEVAPLYNRPWEATNYGTLWPYSPPAPADATLSTDTASTSLNVDLEGWWLCTDGSGTTLVDISGNSVNGTISGTVGWDTTALGTAIEPDGSSGRVDASVSLTGYPITMAAWFKTPSASAADECIMSVADSSVGTNQLRMIIENTTSKLEANGFDGTVVRAASSTTSVDDDEWHLGVAVFASSTSRKIYVDGVLEGTETSSQTMTAFDRSSLAVTADSTPTAYFGGNIQNARVWSRALSDDEITLLYERPFEGITYGDAFHYDPPTPANLTPLDNSSGIMTDCVGWWPLTETDDYASGAADISGSAATFTKAGSVTSDVSSLGTTALFDGVNGTYLRGGTSLLASPSAMTVSAWVNLEAYSSVAGHGIVSRWGSGSTSNQFLLYYPASGTGVRFFVTDGSTNYIAQSTRVPTDFLNRYVHFVGTWDGTDVKLYIDGVEDATIAGPSSINSGGTDNIRIGNYVNDTHPMDGNVANVRIWSRALSAAEVWSIYQNPWLGSAYQASAAAVYYNYILRSKRFRRLS